MPDRDTRTGKLNREPTIEPAALPCPFCGGPANIQHWHGGRPTKRMIACADDCAVAPMVTGETKAEALNEWNTRAEPAPMTSGAKLTKKQREMARHALGLPNWRNQTYRNRYYTRGSTEQMAAWRDLCAVGMATATPTKVKGGQVLFQLTLSGALAALEQGESLCPEDFPLTPAGRSALKGSQSCPK